MEDFSKNKIKEYEFWTVFIYSNQGYLGRCVVWCKREDALDLTDATLQEREELFVILSDIKKAIEKAFDASFMNYAFFGQYNKAFALPSYSSLFK